ncbi:hypothetical protein DFH07DRAFT_353821 [Mycena maculata]|uniref:Uncharacterized protein n=1 Tax=Mycena maculata TaxID=230809 RepID=A0AAD7MGK6_9AGAR|nr:hypothetical protein DFH07DRAFT_353821 [Mycena maculata]
MVCIGMIWRMDPLSMPRTFCMAQAIIVNAATYGLGGICMAWCIQTSYHILRPKLWVNMEESFKWRPIYILPVVVYPLLNTFLLVALIAKYDAVQPTDGMYCDATDPLWVRLVAHISPAVSLFVPAAYISVTSIRRVVKTLKHVERSQRGHHDPPRQIRRERHSAHYAFKQSAVHSDESSPPSPGRQPINPALSGKTEATTGLSFHLPFFRQLQSISQTLAPTSPSRSPSLNACDDDGRASVASSMFPTFAPIVDKSTTYPRRQAEGITDADPGGPWLDGTDADSEPTSMGSEGHEMTAERLELDVQDEHEDGTFRVSYRESPIDHAPTRVSHITTVPKITPHIYRLLFFQVVFTLSLLVDGLSSIIDVAAHHETPTPFASNQISLLMVSWGPIAVFGSSVDVRTQIVRWVWFRQ